MSEVPAVALVTGAAHRVGRAIALGLAAQGYDIMLHYHASGDAITSTIREAADLGVAVESHAADLRSPNEIDRLFQQVKGRFGRLDVLINSAAIMHRIDFDDVQLQDWENTINLNLRAPFLCMQRAAQLMRQADGGCVINISDIAGLRPWSRFPVHSISKAGLEMLTRVAALALGPEIRVNAVAPGPVLKPARMSDARWDEIGSDLPLRRSGRPEDVVEAILFLIQNPWITGETLVVDGGAQLV
jgi:NAD(P)-dependent dehydrogenase (short-subunit alcohol dehydrogenase family)